MSDRAAEYAEIQAEAVRTALGEWLGPQLCAERNLASLQFTEMPPEVVEILAYRPGLAATLLVVRELRTLNEGLDALCRNVADLGEALDEVKQSLDRLPIIQGA